MLFHAGVYVVSASVCLGVQERALACISPASARLLSTHTNAHITHTSLCAVSVNMSMFVGSHGCHCPYLDPATSDSEREKRQKKKFELSFLGESVHQQSILYFCVYYFRCYLSPTGLGMRTNSKELNVVNRMATKQGLH